MSNRGWLLALVVVLVGLGGSGCAFARHRRQTVDLVTARCEGEPTDAAWSSAATVAYGKNGKAQFVWNELGVYCRLCEKHLAGIKAPVCISFSSSSIAGEPNVLREPARKVRFYVPGTVLPFDEALKPSGVMAIEVNARGPDAGATTRELPASQWRFAVTNPGGDELLRRTATITKQVIEQLPPWTAELFVSWQALSDTEKPPAKLWVDVAILKTEWSDSFLKLNAEQ